MVDLLKLAERCEAATGPNYALEVDILRAVNPQATRLSKPAPYTASLDAALTLLPGRDWEWSLEWESSSGIHDMIAVAKIGDPRLLMEATAATPALALCAAALRAREQS